MAKTFDWSSYYSLAQELANQANNSELQEARWRSAISRAYYAVFHEAKNYLQTRVYSNRVFPTKDVHEFVISEFKRLDQTHYKVGIFLERLRLARNKADYTAQYSLTLNDVQFLLTTAAKVIESLAGF